MCGTKLRASVSSSSNLLKHVQVREKQVLLISAMPRITIMFNFRAASASGETGATQKGEKDQSESPSSEYQTREWTRFVEEHRIQFTEQQFEQRLISPGSENVEQGKPLCCRCFRKRDLNIYFGRRYSPRNWRPIASFRIHHRTTISSSTRSKTRKLRREALS